MNDLLFNVPWWIPILLCIFGVALFVNGNKRVEPKIRNIGLAVVLLAIGWAVMSYLVDTDKEKVEKQTRAMIKSVVDGDWTLFKSEMTSTAVLKARDQTVVPGAETITQYARGYTEMMHVKSAVVQNLMVEQTGPLISARFTVISTQDALAPIETTTWQFDWEKTSQGWRSRELRLDAIRDVPADDIAKMLTKVAPR